jgi:hypothetical protein
MGAWSKFPDANDSNIDLFATFIERYFKLLEDSSTNYHLDPNNLDGLFCPGLEIRMGLRVNSIPQFSDEDKSKQNMEILFDLLKFYDLHYDNTEVIGLAISLCRLYGNYDDESENYESFGIGVKTLPKVFSSLTKEMNEWILEKIDINDFDDLIGEQLMEYFKVIN